MRRSAPWACYAGHKLHDGDCIRTGDGKAGVVHLDPKGDSMFEQWIVKFRDEIVPLFNAIDGLKIELDNIDHKSGAGSSVRYMSEEDEIAEYSGSDGGPWFQNLIDRIEDAGVL